MSTGEESKSKVWPKLTFFGDSITQMSWDPDAGCWAAMIANKCGTYFDVDTRGFYGYNTNWALDMLPRQFSREYLEHVQVLTVFFGHNDSWERKQPVSVTVEKYESNLNAMVAYFAENGLNTSEKMILVSPSWYDHDLANFDNDKPKPYNEMLIKDKTHAQKYADAVERVAQKHSIEYLDFFKVTINNYNLSNLFTDGVHFSKAGAQLYFNSIWPLIKAKVQTRYGVVPEALFQEVYYEKHPQYRAQYRGTQRPEALEALARAEAESRANLPSGSRVELEEEEENTTPGTSSVETKICKRPADDISPTKKPSSPKRKPD